MAINYRQQAKRFNEAKAQGMTDDQALQYAGINDPNEFVMTKSGQLEPLVAGTGTRTTAFSSAEQAAADAYYKSLESPGFDERLKTSADWDAPTEWKEPPSSPMKYKTTVTETVSGGSSTTIIAGERTPNLQSKRFESAYDSKNAELTQFNKNNPSDWARKKQGLPPLSAAERQAVEEKRLALGKEAANLKYEQLNAETPSSPTIVREPNTTTNITTVTSENSTVESNVNYANDPQQYRQTEYQINASVPIQPQNSPADITDDPYNFAEQSEEPPPGQRRLRPGSVFEMYGFEEPSEEQPEITGPQDIEPISKNVYYRDGVAVTERIYEDGTLITEEVVNGESEITVDQRNTFVDDPYADADEDGFVQDSATGLRRLPGDVDPNDDPTLPTPNEDDIALNDAANYGYEYDQPISASVQASIDRARIQNTLQQQRKQVNDGDWRVKLRLAPGATYLYEAQNPGILAPLSTKSGTGGVVFPYTPQITTGYRAEYSSYNLTHSNYQGYFYQGSKVEDIGITAVFTAQDSMEAEYMLAVIHFFRSVTKMFYGQDSLRGSPPPLVFLEGFGVYQFNRNPCVVTNFAYSLPNDVDYIRARSPNINGTNMLKTRNRQSLPTNPFSAAWARIESALKPQGINPGAVPGICPAPVPTLGTNSPTYVPTKLTITLTLHPVQSREQVSKEFSLQSYANGDLIKKGFW